MLRGTRQGRETLGFLDRSIQVRLLLSLRGVEPETNQRPSLPIVQVSATRPPPLVKHRGLKHVQNVKVCEDFLEQVCVPAAILQIINQHRKKSHTLKDEQQIKFIQLSLNYSKKLNFDCQYDLQRVYSMLFHVGIG